MAKCLQSFRTILFWWKDRVDSNKRIGPIRLVPRLNSPNERGRGRVAHLRGSSNLTVAAEWNTTDTLAVIVAWSEGVTPRPGSVRSPCTGTSFEKDPGRSWRTRSKIWKTHATHFHRDKSNEDFFLGLLSKQSQTNVGSDVNLENSYSLQLHWYFLNLIKPYCIHTRSKTLILNMLTSGLTTNTHFLFQFCHSHFRSYV